MSYRTFDADALFKLQAFSLEINNSASSESIFSDLSEHSGEFIDDSYESYIKQNKRILALIKKTIKCKK